MVFHWSLSDSKSPQVSRTLLSILAVFNNVVVWMVSTRPPTFKSSSPFSNPLVTVPNAPITISIIITFMFHSFFNSIARSSIIIIIIIIIIILPKGIISSTWWFSLKSDWQLIFSAIQDSFNYSNQCQQFFFGSSVPTIFFPTSWGLLSCCKLLHSAPTMTGITVIIMHNFLALKQGRSIYIFFLFILTLWSASTAKSTSWHIRFFLLITTVSNLVLWSVLDDFFLSRDLKEFCESYFQGYIHIPLVIMVTP